MAACNPSTVQRPRRGITPNPRAAGPARVLGRRRPIGPAEKWGAYAPMHTKWAGVEDRGRCWGTKRRRKTTGAHGKPPEQHRQRPAPLPPPLPEYGTALDAHKTEAEGGLVRSGHATRAAGRRARPPDGRTRPTVAMTWRCSGAAGGGAPLSALVPLWLVAATADPPRRCPPLPCPASPLEGLEAYTLTRAGACWEVRETRGGGILQTERHVALGRAREGGGEGGGWGVTGQRALLRGTGRRPPDGDPSTAGSRPPGFAAPSVVDHGRAPAPSRENGGGGPGGCRSQRREATPSSPKRKAPAPVATVKAQSRWTGLQSRRGYGSPSRTARPREWPARPPQSLLRPIAGAARAHAVRDDGPQR